MQEIETIKLLHAFDLWANRKTLESLAQVADREPKTLTLMAHIYTAWMFWLDRIEGNESEGDWFPSVSLEECGHLADGIEKRSLEFVAGLKDSDLERIVKTRRRDGSKVELKVREILFQLVTHSPHHRGQINLLVRGAGGEPTVANFIRYSLFLFS